MTVKKCPEESELYGLVLFEFDDETKKKVAVNKVIDLSQNNYFNSVMIFDPFSIRSD